MQQTQNYKLNKPSTTDYAKIEALNENADIIDAKLKELDSNKANNNSMTELQQRLTTHKDDDVAHSYYAGVLTEDSGGVYHASIPHITEYKIGMRFTFKVDATNTKSINFINVNGLGNQDLYFASNFPLVIPNTLKPGMIYEAIRSSNGIFMILGLIPLSDSLGQQSSLIAASSNAVKMVNDRLTSRKFIAGGASDANSTSAIGIAIGDISFIKSSQGLAIGTYARIHENSDEASAVGAFTEVTGKYSVALGANTKVLNANEGILGINPNIGTGTHIWKIPGSLTVTGHKNFEIPHPHPTKKHTHIIRHGAVESPTTGDTLYRYSVTATNDGETIEIQLPDYFEYLNTNVDVWVNPDKHFGRAYGEVVGDKLLVTCEKAGTYKALVIGTRNDENVQDWYLKGVEREIGESWTGETYSFEVDEISEVTEFEEVYQ